MMSRVVLSLTGISTLVVGAVFFAACIEYVFGIEISYTLLPCIGILLLGTIVLTILKILHKEIGNQAESLEEEDPESNS